MGREFSVDEIWQLAVGMEEAASEFYRACEAQQSGEAQKLFHDLAAWEDGHRAFFARLRQNAGRDQAAAFKLDGNSEEALYLKALVSGEIYTPSAAAAARAAADKEAALAFALAGEKEAILFYTALARLAAAAEAAAALEEIISEEIKHVRLLNQL